MHTTCPRDPSTSFFWAEQRIPSCILLSSPVRTPRVFLKSRSNKFIDWQMHNRDVGTHRQRKRLWWGHFPQSFIQAEDISMWKPGTQAASGTKTLCTVLLHFWTNQTDETVTHVTHLWRTDPPSHCSWCLEVEVPACQRSWKVRVLTFSTFHCLYSNRSCWMLSAGLSNLF